MQPFEKLNAVLFAIPKYEDKAIGGVPYPQFSNALANSYSELAPEHTWDVILNSIIDRIEIGGYITADIVSTIHSSGIKVGQYCVSLTEKGQEFISNGGYGPTTKFIEISDGDLKMLTMFLAVMPYYERFTTLRLKEKIGFCYTYEERLEFFKLTPEIRIADFLRKHGFSRQEHSDYEVVLTDKGRKLKEAGDYETYVKLAEEEDQKRRERNRIENELLLYQKLNSEWQQKVGNKAQVWNVLTAIISLFATLTIGLMAIYYSSQSKETRPATIQIDYTTLRKLIK